MNLLIVIQENCNTQSFIDMMKYPELKKTAYLPSFLLLLSVFFQSSISCFSWKEYQISIMLLKISIEYLDYEFYSWIHITLNNL